jgi:hypothetical protein
MSAASTDNPHQNYLSRVTHRLSEQTPRLHQELLVRRARAVRPLARERPLTVNVGTALRSYYADVLKEPLPPELARLARRPVHSGAPWRIGTSQGRAIVLVREIDGVGPRCAGVRRDGIEFGEIRRRAASEPQARNPIGKG